MLSLSTVGNDGGNYFYKYRVTQRKCCFFICVLGELECEPCTKCFTWMESSEMVLLSSEAVGVIPLVIFDPKSHLSASVSLFLGRSRTSQCSTPLQRNSWWLRRLWRATS